MPKAKTTTNEWPVMECPACGKTFTTDDNDALEHKRMFCEHCESELAICFVQHTIIINLRVNEGSL
jgi:rRNA maturation endonuclease Nob1